MSKSLSLFLVVIAVLCCNLAFGQSGYVYTQYMDSYYESRSIFLCSDNSVVVLGSITNTDWFHYTYPAITKLDPQGNLLWRRFTGNWDHTITGVDIDENDTITFITTGGSPDRIRFWTIDQAGTINPVSNLTGFPYPVLSFNKAIRTPANEIIAVGKAFQNYDVSSACYFRFSATGDTLATAFWPVDQGSQNQKAAAYDMALMNNGNVLITCSLSSSLLSILEVNPEGDIINRTNLPGEHHYSWSAAISREGSSPSYLVAYSYGDYPTTSIHLYRFEDGQFEPLFSIPNSIVQNTHSMILGPDSIYICGSLGIHGSLVKINVAGDIVWSFGFQGDNQYYLDDFVSYSTALLALASDGCVYWAWGNYGGEQVIIKLLPNGQVPVADEHLLPPIQSMAAYPNPMQDRLSIVVHPDDLSKGSMNTIGIYNIKGQLVRSLPLSKGEAEWDGKDTAGRECPTGIYLLRQSNTRGKISKIYKTK